MTDEQEKSEEQLLKEQIAAIEAEEKAQAETDRLAAMRRRVKRDALKKETEKKLGGREGRAFVIVEGADDLLFVVKKPENVVWMSFQKTEKSQIEWERLYRTCVEESAWERVLKQIEELPLGVESAIVAGIVRMQGGRAEDLLKK